jgi:hypothetical protein
MPSKRKTADERDREIVAKAGRWHSTPRCLTPIGTDYAKEWPNRYEEAAARILNRIVADGFEFGSHPPRGGRG